MRNFFICFFMLVASFTWSKTTDSLDFSSEYVKRIFEGQKIFLWSIENALGDEKGYRSLTLESEWSGSNVKVEDTVIYGLLLSFDNDTYNLIGDDVCSTVSRASEKMKKLFKESVRCVKNIRGSYPLLIVIGENNNEIFKELKEKKASSRFIVPSWYDYQVTSDIPSSIE